MTMNTLGWTVDDGGLTFQVVTEDGQPRPVDVWGAEGLEAEGRAASAGPLLALLEDGAVSPGADGTVAVPHDLAARWDGHQVRQLGLPEVAPYRLNIRGQGVLSSPGFRFVFQLQDRQGRPPIGARRQGVILTVGRHRYTVLDPVYALIEGMERYNAAPERDMDARFAAWAALQTRLPEDARVDGHLRSLNIARADVFTLDTTMDDAFAPLLLGHPTRGTDEVERNAAALPEAVLPAAGQRAFADRFQRLEHAQRRYALPGNWYVMVSEPLRQALQVVREVLDAPAAETRKAPAKVLATFSCGKASLPRLR
jgi:hypothetical protein